MICAICYSPTSYSPTSSLNPLIVAAVRECATVAEAARWQRQRTATNPEIVSGCNALCELPGAKPGDLVECFGDDWLQTGELTGVDDVTQYQCRWLIEPRLLDARDLLLRGTERTRDQLPEQYGDVSAALTVVTHAILSGALHDREAELREAWSVVEEAYRCACRSTGMANEVMREQTQPRDEVRSAMAALPRLQSMSALLERALKCCTAALRLALGRSDAGQLIAEVAS